MGHYIINFTVYTLAMSGLIFFALFVYKKVMNGGFRSNGTKFLEIEETMNVNPRKSLMVVRAGDEHFLVASDMDRTSLISKLEIKSKIQNQPALKKDFMRDYQLVQAKNEDLDTIYPDTNKQKIHLELINDNNPHSPRARAKNSTRNMTTGRTVDFEVNSIRNHGFSTMREMAKKINEI